MNRYNKTLDEMYREWRLGLPALSDRDIECLRRKAAENAMRKAALLEEQKTSRESEAPEHSPVDQ